MSAFGDLIKRGTRALQPAATAVAVGTVYCVTDESRIQERSNGTTWDSFCPAVAAGPAWVAVTNSAASGTAVNFNGLSAYNEIMVFIKQVTATGACIRQLLVSTDNGATVLNASGDYINFDSNGAESNGTVLSFTNGNNATAQSAFIIISNFNTTSPKMVTSGFPATNLCGYIPSASALNAIRVRPHANSFNGGTIYVFGR